MGSCYTTATSCNARYDAIDIRIMMKFKEWLNLQEVGTSTGDVAAFKLPMGGMVTRTWPTLLTVDDLERDKKRHHRHHKKKKFFDL